jgi:hypothetical protein
LSVHQHVTYPKIIFRLHQHLVLVEGVILYILLSLAPQPSLCLGLLLKIRLNFLEASQQFSFLQGRVVSPTPTPIPEDQASVFICPEAGRLPILVASYDTHGLRWDYSYSPVTTRGILKITIIFNLYGSNILPTLHEAQTELHIFSQERHIARMT